MIVSEWIPLVRVGPLSFGASVEGFLTAGTLKTVSLPSDKTGWETFAFHGDEFRVHVEDGKIASVACYSECTLGTVNLIGESFSAVAKRLGGEPPESSDLLEVAGGEQKVYEFDSFGAQVWVLNQRVVTIICDNGK